MTSVMFWFCLVHCYSVHDSSLNIEASHGHQFLTAKVSQPLLFFKSWMTSFEFFVREQKFICAKCITRVSKLFDRYFDRWGCRYKVQFSGLVSLRTRKETQTAAREGERDIYIERAAVCSISPDQRLEFETDRENTKIVWTFYVQSDRLSHVLVEDDSSCYNRRRSYQLNCRLKARDVTVTLMWQLSGTGQNEQDQTVNKEIVVVVVPDRSDPTKCIISEYKHLCKNSVRIWRNCAQRI